MTRLSTKSTDDSKAKAQITLDIRRDEIVNIDNFIQKSEIGAEQNREFVQSTLTHSLPDVWAETAGEGIKVAVIDTGIDTEHAAFGRDRSHPTFRSSVIERAVSINDGQVDVIIDGGELIEGRDLQLVHDNNGHGTHCAGIIAARPLGKDEDRRLKAYEPERSEVPPGSDAISSPTTRLRNSQWVRSDGSSVESKSFSELDVLFSGVAPKSKLLIYKVTKGRSGDANVNDIAEGILQAIDDQADIISISMEAPQGTDKLYGAVHKALWLRKMLVFAAGNQGSLLSNGLGVPAYYGGGLTVASHDRFGRQSGFTSFGGELDFGAPGEDIWSTYTGRGYRKQSGTSMAAPFVAGIVALMLGDRENPTNRPAIRNSEELRRELISSTTHGGYYDPGQLGYGALLFGNYLARDFVEIE